jgi:ATP citrate (pro-S)-lyase
MQAYDSGVTAKEFVTSMRTKNKLIMGIGHRVRSVESPDQRVVIVKKFVKQHFPASPVLDFALQVFDHLIPLRWKH